MAPASAMPGFSCLPNKKRSVEKDEEEVFSEHIVEKILQRVPLKSRTKFKCVSKAWLSLINHLRHTSPPATASGLVFSSKKPFTNQLTLLDIKYQGKNCSVQTSTTHTSLPWLVDSCNGLLLLSSRDGSCLTYHVFSPMKNQCLQLSSGHDFSRPASASLAFDGLQPLQFKVICQFWEEADINNGIITYQIFSSKTLEWREYYNERIPKSELLLRKDFNCSEWSCPSLYRKGHLYWIWSILLLVFDVKIESFELIELPRTGIPAMSVYSGKRLWESEGRLHYCDSTYSGFYIWIWDYVHDSSSSKECNRLIWRPKQRIMFEELVSRNHGVFRIDEDIMSLISPITVKPCGFDEDFEVLYFQLPGIIVAYSFVTRKVVKVLSDSAIGLNIHDNTYPFIFNAVELSS